MPSGADWDRLMQQRGTPQEHEHLLNTWLGNIAHYQSCVATYEASRHAFYLGTHSSSMYKLVLESGSRLHKQFAILMFHFCSKHTQSALPPHVLLFFELMAPRVETWLMGVQENGREFSTSMDSTQEYVLGVKVEPFASHLINRVYVQTYHRCLADQRSC